MPFRTNSEGGTEDGDEKLPTSNNRTSKSGTQESPFEGPTMGYYRWNDISLNANSNGDANDPVL